MNKLLVYGTLTGAAVAAVVLTPMAAGAIAGHYQGGDQGSSQAIRARDGSGVGATAGIHTETQDRQYVHLADGTCDGTGVGDGSGVGAQQRMHGRE